MTETGSLFDLEKKIIEFTANQTIFFYQDITDTNPAVSILRRVPSRKTGIDHIDNILSQHVDFGSNRLFPQFNQNFAVLPVHDISAYNLIRQELMFLIAPDEMDNAKELERDDLGLTEDSMRAIYQVIDHEKESHIHLQPHWKVRQIKGLGVTIDQIGGYAYPTPLSIIDRPGIAIAGFHGLQSIIEDSSRSMQVERNTTFTTPDGFLLYAGTQEDEMAKRFKSLHTAGIQFRGRQLESITPLDKIILSIDATDVSNPKFANIIGASKKLGHNPINQSYAAEVPVDVLLGNGLIKQQDHPCLSSWKVRSPHRLGTFIGALDRQKTINEMFAFLEDDDDQYFAEMFKYFDKASKSNDFSLTQMSTLAQTWLSRLAYRTGINVGYMDLNHLPHPQPHMYQITTNAEIVDLEGDYTEFIPQRFNTLNEMKEYSWKNFREIISDVTQNLTRLGLISEGQQTQFVDQYEYGFSGFGDPLTQSLMTNLRNSI